MTALLRTLAIARKEFRQLRRDRLTGGMIIGIPLLQVLLFGYAINTDVRHLRAGVADLASTQRSRLLIADAEASQVVNVVERVQSAAELEALLRRGSIAVGLFIPYDFDRRVYRLGTAALHGEPAQVPAQLLVDGGDPVILGAAQGLAHLPVKLRTISMPAAGVGRDSFEVRAYYNPERRSVVQIVPGLIGVILTMTMVLFTAVAIVRERERGNLELLITTPVRTVELMVGKILPYIAIGLIQVTLVLALGVFVFRVPVRGSLLDLYLAAALFVGASLTLGLLISTFAQTQFQAMQMMVFIFLPSILLSGFMFPFDGMPRLAQLIGEVLPLTHFLRLARGILLRGAALGELRAEMAPLAIFLTLTLGVAILRFRKRLD
jgi:ABC-2 type transport system permease protein